MTGRTRRKTPTTRLLAWLAHRQTSVLLAPLFLVLLLASAWLSQRHQTLQRELTGLRRELSWHEDELRRERSEWFEATTRSVVVRRARNELGLVEPDPADKQVLVVEAMPGDGPADEGAARVLALARRLQRYGDIPAAVAGEGER